MSLYELRSQTESKNQLTNCIQVVEWFTKTNSELREKHGKVVPSLAFYHIPAHAMLQAQERGRLDPHRTPGANRERVNPQGTGEWKYDSQDVKFMEALLNTEGLIAGFSGHDHQNDWYDFLPELWGSSLDTSLVPF